MWGSLGSPDAWFLHHLQELLTGQFGAPVFLLLNKLPPNLVIENKQTNKIIHFLNDFKSEIWAGLSTAPAQVTQLWTGEFTF